MGASINETLDTKGLAQGLDCIKGLFLVSILIANISKFLLNTQIQAENRQWKALGSSDYLEK